MPRNFTEKQNLACDEYIQDNEQIRVIKHNGLTVAVSVFDDGDYFGADVFVKNEREERVLIDREANLLGFFRTEKIEGKMEFCELLLPEKIVAKMKRRVMWANVLGAIASSGKTTTTKGDVTIIDNRGNTATGTYEEKREDKRAQIEEAKRNRERNSNLNSASANLLDSALKSNTLFPNQSTSGLVFFKREKKARLAMYVIEINGVSYDFLTMFGK